MKEKSGKGAEPADIKGWLLDRIARLLKIRPEEVDTGASFKSFGLDSIEAAGIAGDLEVKLGRRLEPTLLWDHPNVDSLVRFLEQAPGPKKEKNG